MRGRNPESGAAIHQSGKEPIIALYSDDLGRMSMMSRDAATEDGAVVSCAILDDHTAEKRIQHLFRAALRWPHW